MIKYIFQRVILTVFALSVIFGICGNFIDGFYSKKYDNVKIIKNIECRHYQFDKSTSCKDLGRLVKFIYVKDDGTKDTDYHFFTYNNEIDKCITSKKYNQLVKEHVGYVTRDWLIGILIGCLLVSGIISIPICMQQMDVKYDYWGRDPRDIALFRIKAFCWWKKFTGHPVEIVNEYRERELNEINCIRYFDRHSTPYYSEIRKDYEKFVAEWQK